MARELFLSLSEHEYANSSRSFIPEDSIMITVIVTTHCFVAKYPGGDACVPRQHGIHPRVHNKSITAL